MFKRHSSYILFLTISGFLVMFGNLRFFSNVLEVYPLDFSNSLFLISLALVFISINVLIFALLCIGPLTKPILVIILLTSSFSAYFMDSYNIVIDDVMICNILQTAKHEALDLFSFKQVLYLLFLGLIPSYFVLKAQLPSLTLTFAFIIRCTRFDHFNYYSNGSYFRI